MSKAKSVFISQRICLFFLVSVLLFGCSDIVYEENIHCNEIEKPWETDFCQDTISFGKLASDCCRYIFRLDESSASITDNTKYTFHINELLQVRATSSGDSIRITSYSAKTIYGITLEIYLPELNHYLPAVYFDSIPGFSQFEFKPSFIGKRILYKYADEKYVSFEYPYLDMNRMTPRLVGDDAHLKMLQQIDAQWKMFFSNYDWSSENTAANWREMRPIFAREWIVIMTNYAYMMTTPEYKYVMANFSRIFGGELCDNEKTPFTADDYAERQNYFKRPHTFRLGRTGDQVSGLGGGTTLSIAGYNFYGHYASYSGWEAVGHEFMHCMGYSHSSNMTYAVGGVGWTEFIWQLHIWLSREKKLPYLDRHLLDFTNPDYVSYRDNMGIRGEFLNDVELEKKILNFYNGSKLVKYFKENPLTEK